MIKKIMNAKTAEELRAEEGPLVTSLKDPTVTDAQLDKMLFGRSPRRRASKPKVRRVWVK